MSYPRPTIVNKYEDLGIAFDRHGKQAKLKNPIYSSTSEGFRKYLEKANKAGQFKFKRGTLCKILSQYCRPSEGKLNFIG